MSPLLYRIRGFIREHDLIPPGTRVIAAVSGGSDSVALACILRELHNRHELCLAGLAHFNHRLRRTADRDEQHTATVAARLGVSLLTDGGDIAARARAERRSLEVAARTARYQFFERARDYFHADLVALGHTRDDQAETMLLRLVRGAGLRGLASMHPRRGCFVRPLLACRRSELRALLAEFHIDFVDDDSNDDPAIPRNRVRAELVPLLEERFNPSITEALANEADLAREVWQWLQHLAGEWIAGNVRASDKTRRIDLTAFGALARPIQREVLWQLMTVLGRPGKVEYGHVSDALRATALSGPASIDGPGVRLERIGGEVVLTSRDAASRGTPPNFFRYPLSIPGEVQLPAAGSVLSAEVVSQTEPGTAGIDRSAFTGAGPAALIRTDRLHGDLAVRNGRPGDRFQPFGLNGRKTLQDFFVDRKIARSHRRHVPLVVDDDDRIVWVAGHRIDETFRVTDGAQPMLLLRLKQTR
jgi:tRNA(Ile)-lysidine synthase